MWLSITNSTHIPDAISVHKHVLAHSNQYVLCLFGIKDGMWNDTLRSRQNVGRYKVTSLNPWLSFSHAMTLISVSHRHPYKLSENTSWFFFCSPRPPSHSVWCACMPRCPLLLCRLRAGTSQLLNTFRIAIDIYIRLVAIYFLCMIR